MRISSVHRLDHISPRAEPTKLAAVKLGTHDANATSNGGDVGGCPSKHAWGSPACPHGNGAFFHTSFKKENMLFG